MSDTKTLGRESLDKLDRHILQSLSGAYAEPMRIHELSAITGIPTNPLKEKLSKLVDKGLVAGNGGFKLTEVGSGYLYHKYNRKDLSDTKSDSV
ncbi:MAG TPA: hypothetical protein VND15_00245 [Candidatus Acidoferrales bacterium]|nr:hypothetical protein [Candidatus Acidoferrales bacterium]